MGADLTIEKDGTYFRDSYNPSNSWWYIGMSYWNLSDELEKKDMLKDGKVTLEGVKYINELLSKHKFEVSKAKKIILANKKKGDISKEESVEEFLRMLKKNDAEMREFWKKALDLKSEVGWSV